MKIHSVIFDLDGTLIDSAPAILTSIRAAFDQARIEPARPLTKELIGPPLSQILTSLLTDETIDKLPGIIEGFKSHYDESGYRETGVFEGVPEMLSELRHMQLRLYIATNKRIVPTRKIVDHFEWNEFFSGLYALDCFSPVLPDKSAMLDKLRQILPGVQDGAIYIGDRSEDAEAARDSSMPFIMVNWGYGSSLLTDFTHQIVSTPTDIPTQIANINANNNEHL